MKHSLASSSRGALCRLLLFQLETYVMPDSVVEIVPAESVATALPFDHTYDQLILDGVY